MRAIEQQILREIIEQREELDIFLELCRKGEQPVVKENEKLEIRELCAQDADVAGLIDVALVDEADDVVEVPIIVREIVLV